MAFNISVLVVAGGAGGGCNIAGAGGAGQVIYNSAYSVTSAQVISVTVGSYGAGSSSESFPGSTGGNSIFGTITCNGGIGGTSSVGLTGSPGGASGDGSSGGLNYNGGGGDYSGGGGGGYGVAGGNAISGHGGNGGAGFSSSISGSAVTYGSGGGGGAYTVTPGNGSGDAGSGGGNHGNGTSATGYGNGGGGGGSFDGTGGNGSQGIVIISYPTGTYGPDGTGGTITYFGGNTIHTFTSSGTFTAPNGSTNATINASILSLTASLLTPTLIVNSTILPSVLNLTTTLYTPLVQALQLITPPIFSLTTTLHTPSLIVNSTIKPSVLSLTASLHNPTLVVPGINAISFASKIISYNPLIIVTNTSPVRVSIVDVSIPDSPVYITHNYPGADYALDVQYNSLLGMIYVACANGIILEIDASTPTSYTINNTGATGNLTSLAILSTFFDIYGGTDFNTGEVVNMYEGSAIQVACDIRFSQSIQNILNTFVNTTNGKMLLTDIRFSQTINDVLGCDVRFISEAFSSLQTPIARPDFVVYINGIEVTDVKLDSIEITHSVDEKSQATFILARKHDNINYILNPDGTQGVYSPITGNPTVQITIQGHEEFGYNTPAYIWDIDTKSQNEQVKIVAYSELPQQDDNSSVTLSIPGINEKLSIYHALINNPIIDNPFLLPDDINPPFYLGVLIDNGYERIQNVTQFQTFTSIGMTQENKVNYVFGSGDSGIVDIHGENVYFAPLQNWTYFWFGHATNFITGETWQGFLNQGSSYLGTSPSSLTSKTWNVDYIDFWNQRVFPNSEYRGTKSGIGLSTVYPSDFLGVIPLPYNPDRYDTVIGINPFGNATTVDQVLRNHTPMTFTGAEILAMKQKLTLLTNPGSSATIINGVNYLVTATGDLIPMPLNVSTKIIDLIDSKFGITFGSAPFKKVSCQSGILKPITKWEDDPNGLFFHTEQGYDYTNYMQLVGEVEYLKLQNINGSVLPKTKCDIEVFLDGYYHYKIALLKRLNIDNTTQPNIYNNNSGFPVSVKSIHISAKDMKVSLNCSNAWSRLEMLQIEGHIPDPNFYLITEKLVEYSPKLDPNTLQDTA